MRQDLTSLTWVLLSLLIALLAFQPRFGLTALWRSCASKKRRRLYEDALKHIVIVRNGIFEDHVDIELDKSTAD